MSKSKPQIRTLADITHGGAYELRNGAYVQVEEPTAEPPGPQAARAEAGPGEVVGATTGAPLARAEVAAAAAAPK